jgi:hypothetical protein
VEKKIEEAFHEGEVQNYHFSRFKMWTPSIPVPTWVPYTCAVRWLLIIFTLQNHILGDFPETDMKEEAKQ